MLKRIAQKDKHTTFDKWYAYFFANRIEHLEHFKPLFYAVFRGRNSRSNDSILKALKLHF